VKLTWPGNLTDGHYVSPQGVAASLQRVYEDQSYRDALAQAAYRNATRPEFNWGVAVAQWKRLFKEAIETGEACAPQSLIHGKAQL